MPNPYEGVHNVRTHDPGGTIDRDEEFRNEWGDTTQTPHDGNNLVSVTAADTVAAFLDSKVVAGANITLNVLNPGADEQLEIVAAAAPGGQNLVTEVVDDGVYATLRDALESVTNESVRVLGGATYTITDNEATPLVVPANVKEIWFEPGTVIDGDNLALMETILTLHDDVVVYNLTVKNLNRATATVLTGIKGVQLNEVSSIWSERTTLLVNCRVENVENGSNSARGIADSVCVDCQVGVKGDVAKSCEISYAGCNYSRGCTASESDFRAYSDCRFISNCTAFSTALVGEGFRAAFQASGCAVRGHGIGFIGNSDRIVSCRADSCTNGFDSSCEISNCEATNCTVGFLNCDGVVNNFAQNNTTGYKGCTNFSPTNRALTNTTDFDNNIRSQNPVVTPVSDVAHGRVLGEAVKKAAGVNQYDLALADTAVNAEVAGVVSAVKDVDNYEITELGQINLPGVLTDLVTFYLSPTVPGALTTTKPTTVGQIVKPVINGLGTDDGSVLQYIGVEITGPVTPIQDAASESYLVFPDVSGPGTVFLGEMPVLSLDDGSVKGVVSHFDLPRDIDLANDDPVAHYALVCSVAGGGNADVQIRAQVKYISAGELVTKAVDETLLTTEAIVDVLGELQTAVTFPLDRALMAASDHVEIHVERLGTDVLDTFTGSVGFMQTIRLEYTRK